jgi:hypothetical protein
MLSSRRLADSTVALALAVALFIAWPSTAEASVSVQVGEPIELQLPEAPTGPLAVEVDGIDVTVWVSVDGQLLSLDPRLPIDPGQHRVDVFEIDADGAFRPRGSWNVEVRSAERLRELSGAGGVGVQVLYRVWDQDIMDAYDRTTASGAARYEGQMADGPWSAQIRAPLLYDSEGSHGSLGRRFDPTDYWLGTALGPASLDVGHHTPEPSSLVLQGFYRRGISAHLDTPMRTRVSTFIFRTDPITGFRESFGITDEDRRTMGVTVATEPLPIRIGTLELAGTYLDATGDESGDGVGVHVGPGHPEEGNAYSVSADGHFFEQRIRLRGEYARTHFDFDSGGRVPVVHDSAYSLLATVEPWPGAVVLGQPAQAVFSWEQSDVGTFFRSLGNPGAQNDLWTRRYEVNLYWAGLSLMGSWSRNRDNRDDEEDQITYRQDDVLLEGSYTPHWLTVASREDWTRFLGTPTLRGRWWRFRTKPLANDGTPVFYEDPTSPGLCFDCVTELVGVDETRRQWEIALGSRYGRWGWNASHARTHFDDRKGLSSDSVDKTTSADVDVQLVDRVTVRARFQLDKTHERDPAFETTRHLVGLELQATPIRDRLDTNVRVDWTKDENSDHTVDERRTVVSAYATWTALAQSNHRPGISVSVFGSYEEVIDQHDPIRDLDAYQLYVQLAIQWSGRH